MLDRVALAGLHPGDVVEAGAIFAGITKEPVALRVIEQCEGGDVEFVAAYFGVTLCKVRAVVIRESVTWVVK